MAITLDQVKMVLSAAKKDNMRKFSFVFNILPKNSFKGDVVGHWCVIYVDMEDDYEIDYYDPLAEKITDSI